MKNKTTKQFERIAGQLRAVLPRLGLFFIVIFYLGRGYIMGYLLAQILPPEGLAVSYLVGFITQAAAGYITFAGQINPYALPKAIDESLIFSFVLNILICYESYVLAPDWCVSIIGCILASGALEWRYVRELNAARKVVLFSNEETVKELEQYHLQAKSTELLIERLEDYEGEEFTIKELPIVSPTLPKKPQAVPGKKPQSPIEINLNGSGNGASTAAGS